MHNQSPMVRKKKKSGAFQIEMNFDLEKNIKHLLQ